MTTEYVTAREFSEHAKNEEQNQKVTNDALHEGNVRMGNIEEHISELASDLKPLKALYNAVIGASVLGTFSLGLLLYIYTGAQERIAEDRVIVRSLADSVQKHTILIEKMVQKHEELERDTRRELDRIEKTLDKVGRL